MASIFDLDHPFAPPTQPEDSTPAQKRSKKREGLTTTQSREGRRKLADMVDRAFQTLHEAMEVADYATAVKAAVAILDRTGFGPKSTMDVNTTSIDLSSLSKEELAERAARIAQMLRGARDAQLVTQDNKQALALVPTQTIN